MVVAGELQFQHLKKKEEAWKSSGFDGIQTQASQVLIGC